MTSSVSPQNALSALYEEATPVPTTPPGMQPPAAPEHHVLSPTPARSLQSAIDAAAEAPRAESADVDTKIAEVEARLSATINGLFASWTASER